MFKIPSKTVIRNMFSILFLAAIIAAALSPASFSGPGGIIAGITGTTIVKAAPSVTTQTATNITTSSAILHGSFAEPDGDEYNVFFRYGITTGYGSTIAGVPPSLTSAGDFTATIPDLEANTEYHFQAFAQFGITFVYGNDMTFTTATPTSPPVVATDAASGISTTSATLNGSLTNPGSASSVAVSFEYGITTSYGSTVVGLQSPLTGAGDFSAALTGLTPGNTYHFRAVAVGDGTARGGDRSFTAAPTSPPSVATDPADGITTTGATLNGSLTNTGSAASVTVSFEYGATTSYGSTIAGVPPALTGDGDFTAALTGLTPDTTYHFRAVAEGDGTDEGNDRSFTTDPSSPPVVSTGEAGDITNTGATLAGNLTDMGGAGSVTVSFEYGETTSYGSTTTPQAMTETGTFNVSVTGLTPGTTYHFRAVAEGDGTDYGGDESFTTTASTSPPVVSTGSASDITGTGATLAGTLTDTGSDDAVTVSFQYGTTTGYGEEVIGSPSTRSSAGTFTAALTGLTPGNTYHFRAKAVGNGTAYGADQSFTTSTSAPVVVTQQLAVSDVLSTRATLKGNLTDTGGAGSVTVSFEWGTTTSYGSTATSPLMNKTGSFTAEVTDLTPGTTYHFRAKATGDGTSYGDDVTFTTPQLPENITVTTFQIIPQTVQIGKKVKISITCENIGGSPSVYPVILKINGVEEKTEEVSLDPGESQEVTFEITESEVGTYQVDVNGLKSSFVVQESTGSTDEFDWILIAGIVGGTLVVGLIVLFIFRRNMY